MEIFYSIISIIFMVSILLVMSYHEHYDNVNVVKSYLKVWISVFVILVLLHMFKLIDMTGYIFYISK